MCKTAFKAHAENPDLIVRQDKAEVSKSTKHVSDQIRDFHKSEMGYWDIKTIKKEVAVL